MSSPEFTVEVYPSGVEVRDVRPGDVYLTSGRKFMSRAIKLAQLPRFGHEAARWSHAGVFTSESGHVVESLEWGPEHDHISRYRDAEVAVVRIEYEGHDREQALAFVDSCLRAKWRYSYLSILSIAVSLATGSRLQFSRAGTAICSGLVASALVRAGFIFPVGPDYMTPAGLAIHFGLA